MERYICQGVRLYKLPHYADACNNAVFLRRPDIFKVAVGSYNLRLIYGNPKLHILTECFYRLFCVPDEVLRELFIEQPTLVAQPKRQCPMPQRNKRLHAALAYGFYHLTVTLYFFFVELPFFRLNSRPLDRKAVRIVAKLFCDIEVLAEAVIVIAGYARNIIFFM